MQVLHLILIVAVLFGVELLYFKLADRFNIIDKPNERSSHTQVTIRGGGIIFHLAWIINSILNSFAFPYVTIGVLLIAIISFLDDRMELSSRLRLLVHLIAFTLCFIELDLFNLLDWWVMPILFVVAIGCVNAINFMDGINGITGLYALSILVPIYLMLYPNALEINGIIYLIASVLVFGTFNFRKKAKCFAGDVGSVSMGYLLIFFILSLIFLEKNALHSTNQGQSIAASNNFDFKYILLLSLYGVDAILTIIHRLMLKENIFKAHRKHLYQYLANEMKWPHLIVAAIYAFIQFGINIWVLYSEVSFFYGFVFLLCLCVIYIVLKKSIISRIK